MNLKSHKNASVNKVSKTLQKYLATTAAKLSRLLESLIVLHLVTGHRSQQISKHNYDKHLKSHSKWLKMSMCPPKKVQTRSQM